MSGDEPKAGSGGAASSIEVKQQLAQNEKLKETLVKMRDLLAHEKNENGKLTKVMQRVDFLIRILLFIMTFFSGIRGETNPKRGTDEIQ